LGTVALANERLRALLLERRVTVAKLAEAVQVDAKTVERWIMAGRVPYRKHRYNVAAFFGVDESFIWPDALDHDQVMAASESEIVAVYPYRRAVPRDAWGHLFGQAEQEIGILAYSCYFLAEDAGLRQLIAEKAESGARVRILLGDPESPFVLQRGQSEGICDTMPAKVRSAIAMFRPLGSVENVEIRLHGTILYNSIFRADDQLFVNTHIYGFMANNAPFFHLRKIPGGAIAATYLESFERVWSEAAPLPEGNDG
jgi:transcriptional regulator with XRE-family HTH domain